MAANISAATVFVMCNPVCAPIWMQLKAGYRLIEIAAKKQMDAVNTKLCQIAF